MASAECDAGDVLSRVDYVEKSKSNWKFYTNFDPLLWTKPSGFKLFRSVSHVLNSVRFELAIQEFCLSVVAFRIAAQSPSKNPPRIKTASIHAAPTNEVMVNRAPPAPPVVLGCGPEKKPTGSSGKFRCTTTSTEVVFQWGPCATEQFLAGWDTSSDCATNKCWPSALEILLCCFARSPWTSGFGEPNLRRENPVHKNWL